MTKKKKVVVTGGAGELGTEVLRRLIADRTVGEIVSIDLRPPMVASKRLQIVQADVRDADFAKHLIGADALVHLAFIVTQNRPRAVMQSVNVEGSKNVFRAAAAAGVKQIVYTSSVAAYGVVQGHPVPIVESTPRRHQPGFAYSANKFEVEAFLDEFERAHAEIAIARLRPAILVGAHMDHALGDAFKRRTLLDNGDTPMPLVWDEDVADAALLAIQKNARGAFNLAADEPESAAALARATGMRLLRAPRLVVAGVARLSPLLSRFGVMRSVDPAWVRETRTTMVMSSARARGELGWKPRCPTARAVLERYLEVVPRKLDRRIDVFLRLCALAGRRMDELPEEARRIEARIHLRLTGPEGGDVGLIFDRGRLLVERAAPRPPTAVVTLKAKTFLAILAGRTDFATAGLTGKVRVEGEALTGLYVQGVISMFRERLKITGPAGLVTRQLDRWLQKGVTP